MVLAGDMGIGLMKSEARDKSSHYQDSRSGNRNQETKLVITRKGDQDTGTRTQVETFSEMEQDTGTRLLFSAAIEKIVNTGNGPGIQIIIITQK